jgi:hypothetical protein
MTPYPACAKTALRMGANTLSAEIERTAGRISFLVPSTDSYDATLVAESIACGQRRKQVKKGLIFVKFGSLVLVRQRASPSA